MRRGSSQKWGSGPVGVFMRPLPRASASTTTGVFRLLGRTTFSRIQSSSLAPLATTRRAPATACTWEGEGSKTWGLAEGGTRTPTSTRSPTRDRRKRPWG